MENLIFLQLNSDFIQYYVILSNNLKLLPFKKNLNSPMDLIPLTIYEILNNIYLNHVLRLFNSKMKI